MFCSIFVQPFSKAMGPKSFGYLFGGDNAQCAAIKVCTRRPNIPLAVPTLCAAHVSGRRSIYRTAKIYLDYASLPYETDLASLWI